MENAWCQVDLATSYASEMAVRMRAEGTGHWHNPGVVILHSWEVSRDLGEQVVTWMAGVKQVVEHPRERQNQVHFQGCIQGV